MASPGFTLNSKSRAAESAWDLAAEKLTDEQARLVHLVYGLAKDFGVSGFRTGAVATRHGHVISI